MHFFDTRYNYYTFWEADTPAGGRWDKYGESWLLFCKSFFRNIIHLSNHIHNLKHAGDETADNPSRQRKDKYVIGGFVYNRPWEELFGLTTDEVKLDKILDILQEMFEKETSTRGVVNIRDEFTGTYLIENWDGEHKVRECLLNLFSSCLFAHPLCLSSALCQRCLLLK